MSESAAVATKNESATGCFSANRGSWSFARLLATASERPFTHWKQRGTTIPELALVPDEAWFDVASNSHLATDAGLRRALAELRSRASILFSEKLGPAFNAFVREHQGGLPDHVSQLLPYFKSPTDPSWLDRYTMVNSGLISPLPSNARPNEFIALKALTDSSYDQILVLGGMGTFSFENIVDSSAGSNRVTLSSHSTPPTGSSIHSDSPTAISRLLRQFYRNQNSTP